MCDDFDDIDTLLYEMAAIFEYYVQMYNNSRGFNCQDMKYSAYELARWMRRIDSEVGDAAVTYLRDNGL